MSKIKNVAGIRRNYGKMNLEEQYIHSDPMIQFDLWFAELLEQEENDPTAMVLSTIDEDGFPDSRVVLLKAVEEGGFTFFTNYKSAKGMQLDTNPHAALNFYWPNMVRQVRVRGLVERISKEQSDSYFATRPFHSQLGAIASPQSQRIVNRQFLDDKLNELIAQYDGTQSVERPLHWGGYRLIPVKIEFWQGRDNRLHDRIAYSFSNNHWTHDRLAP